MPKTTIEVLNIRVVHHDRAEGTAYGYWLESDFPRSGGFERVNLSVMAGIPMERSPENDAKARTVLQHIYDSVPRLAAGMQVPKRKDGGE
jgi:hypothetical protein